MTTAAVALLALVLMGAQVEGAHAEAKMVAKPVVETATAPPTKPTCPADALGTSRTLVVGTQPGPSIGLKSYPRTLPLADHEVVLTFDDGPGPMTPAVLDALAHECVKATFFLIGRNAEAEPDLVEREVADGHTVGHHTFSHPARTLRRMTTQAAEADIERGIEADDKAAYGAVGRDPRVPFFRFPGFADTPEIDAWLSARNIAIFGTDIWALDWLELTPQAELAYVMRQLDKTKRGIILLHDTRRSTAEMVPALLRALKAGGYKIVALVPGPGSTATVDAPKGWTSETDRVIAEVFAAEDRGPRRRHYAGGNRYALMRQRPGRFEWVMPRYGRPEPDIYRILHRRRFGAAKRTRTSTGLPTSTSS